MPMTAADYRRRMNIIIMMMQHTLAVAQGSSSASVSYDMTLTWDGVTTSPYLNFDLDDIDDLLEDDIIRLTVNTTDYDHTVTGAEAASHFLSVATGGLVNGSYNVTAYHRRAGVTLETSNTEAVTVNDTVAGVLGALTDSALSSTSGRGTGTIGGITVRHGAKRCTNCCWPKPSRLCGAKQYACHHVVGFKEHRHHRPYGGQYLLYAPRS
jgi:hypothetical protein